MRLRKMASLVSVALLALIVGVPGGAVASPTVSPFPIGIHFGPDPTQTTDARYAEIADMNVNFIVGSNEVVTHTTNDEALTQAAAHGLKLLVHDFGLVSKSEMLTQKSTGGGWFVRRDTSLGQTFTTPATGSGWFIGTVAVKYDKQKWQPGTKLKLCVYDGTGKTVLYGCDSITGPIASNYPEFYINANVQTNQTYYMELSTLNNWDIGKIEASTSNVYAGGQAYVNGTAQNSDLYFEIRFSQPQSVFTGSSRPSDAYLDFLTDSYKTNPALLGYNLKDEPTFDLMPMLKEATNRLKANDPDHMVFANLFPSYATTAQLFESTSVTGEYVTSTQAVGQTFTTGPATSSITSVQWYIDSSSFASGESMKLTLWNSTAKTTKIAETTLSAPTSDFPQIPFPAAVSPNTTYYMELTHNGGGNNQIGWVVRSPNGVNWTDGGNGYVNGASINSDFWFTINQNFAAFSYEDYVSRWVNRKLDVLVFDHYPFLANGTMRIDYYTNLEIIRRQALAGGIDFWSYIQSVGITDGLKVPTQADMRYQIYTNLAYGAKGIIYFTYFTPPRFSWVEPFEGGLILPDGTKNTSYAWAQTINGELMKLGPTLTALKSQAVYHTGTLPSGTTALPGGFFWQPASGSDPLVIGSFTNGSGRKYVMAVNRDTANSRTVTFNLNPKPATVTEISKSTGTEIATNYNSTTGSLSGTFAPGEGKLYALPVGY